VDLAGAPRAAFLSAVKAPPQRMPAAQAPTPARPAAALEPAAFVVPIPPRKPWGPARIRTIVVDPGHGGADPGTVGARGTAEKHVVLALARELRAVLEATGRYKVVLTRQRDLFVRLRHRVARARDADAELFVSLHADSMANRSVRGASVYTLSERASDREAALLAEKENKADLIAGVDLTGESSEVTNILIDLAQRETMNQSARFGMLLIKELKREVRLLRNTHRFAGFAVLKAPDVPSVLIEAGFLSNRRDETALGQKAYRLKLAQATTRAIDAYFKNVEEALVK
jgi:N-acetylmuramoyl-L-alanine amidase